MVVKIRTVNVTGQRNEQKAIWNSCSGLVKNATLRNTLKPPGVTEN